MFANSIEQKLSDSSRKNNVVYGKRNIPDLICKEHVSLLVIRMKLRGCFGSDGENGKESIKNGGKGKK